VGRAGGAATRRILEPLASQMLRAPAVRRVGAAAAALRGRRLALVFHRIIEDDERAGGVVPAVPEATFRRQLDQLLEMGDIVPLPSMLADASVRSRPRFALTFDDDSLSHHQVVLPVLRDRGVSATFFLGGRSLHGLGPLWFEILDDLVLSRGVAEVARSLGTSATDVRQLAERCERDPQLQRAIVSEDAVVVEHLSDGHIAGLEEAGMTIGFHTLHHPLLTRLSGDALDTALTEGRAELEDVVGHRIDLFAYPHGKADGVVRAGVRRAGYVAAWTGRPRAFSSRDDPYRLGRWESGRLLGPALDTRLLATLHRGDVSVRRG
jgi:peptidoglycan/xylan/chitin deacetylase (PgdA/CDA1 family)